MGNYAGVLPRLTKIIICILPLCRVQTEVFISVFKKFPDFLNWNKVNLITDFQYYFIVIIYL